MIEESKADPVCIANATGKQDFTDNAEPCGAVECWDTVLRWISFETPATRWLASVQVPDPDSENVVEYSTDPQKGDRDESATVGESL